MLYQAGKWYKEGEYQKVKEVLQDVAEQPDVSSDALRLLASSEIQLGQYEEAEKRLEVIVKKTLQTMSPSINWLYSMQEKAN